MRKFLIFGLAAALLLSCLVGCGKKEPQGESSTPVLGDDTGTTTDAGDTTTVGGDVTDTTTDVGDTTADGGDATDTTTGSGDDATTDANSSETGDSMTDASNTTVKTDGSSTATGGSSASTAGSNKTTTGDKTTEGKTTNGKTISGKTTDRQKTTGNKKTTTTAKTTAPTKAPATDTDAALGAYRNAAPNMKEITAYNPTKAEWKNIKAITYDGATIDGKKTKVFAYIGFPEGASASNKVPAIVLVHGGGGHAFAEWVKIWNDRGYAAIAMDTTGYFPSEAGKGVAGAESDNVSTLWYFGLYGTFAEAGYVNAPNNDEMSSSAKPLDQQWMYHSIASTMMAHNILQADSRVDGKKIGITGISWGGIITSLAIGYDTDYAFAIPIYGSAYLDEAHSYMGRSFSEANTKKLWSAADRLDRVKFPVMWLGYASDVPFSINSNSRSYMHTKATGSVLSMKISMGHSHGLGWNPQESYYFADSVVGKRGAITKVVNEPTVKKNADGTYSVTATIAADPKATELKAQAAYIKEPLSYSSKNGGHPSMDQTWKGQRCTLNGNTVTVTLPKDAVDFQIIITTKTAEGKYDISTQFVQGLK